MLINAASRTPTVATINTLAIEMGRASPWAALLRFLAATARRLRRPPVDVVRDGQATASGSSVFSLTAVGRVSMAGNSGVDPDACSSPLWGAAIGTTGGAEAAFGADTEANLARGAGRRRTGLNPCSP